MRVLPRSVSLFLVAAGWLAACAGTSPAPTPAGSPRPAAPPLTEGRAPPEPTAASPTDRDGASTDAGVQRSLPRPGSGLDVPAQPGAVSVDATRLCLDDSGTGAILLYLERDCTCGEPLGCSAEAHGQDVDVRFFQNPGPGICDDCYATGTTCTMPRVAAPGPARLRVNGRVVAELVAGESGRLPAVGCR